MGKFTWVGVVLLVAAASNTYAAVCFIQDRVGGAPHAMQHDMYDVFTLS